MAADVLGAPVDGAISIDDHRALLAITIGPQQADLSFEQRLAHEQGWALGFAKRAVQEYLRFAYLCVHAGPCTPSVEVDQVWHLHLTYSRDYWGPFTEMLGKELHHGPTEGGEAEDTRYEAQYASTLAAYARSSVGHPRRICGRRPRRFASFPHQRWVDLRKHTLTSRRTLALIGAGLFFGGLALGWSFGRFDRERRKPHVVAADLMTVFSRRSTLTLLVMMLLVPLLRERLLPRKARSPCRISRQSLRVSGTSTTSRT